MKLNYLGSQENLLIYHAKKCISGPVKLLWKFSVSALEMKLLLMKI